MRFINLFSTILLLMSSVEALAFESDYIKGVSKEQWSIIKKIGDPLNCEERIAKLDNLVFPKITTTANGYTIGGEYLITAEKFNKQKAILKRSLKKNKITVLDAGEYNIDETIKVRNGAILVGKEGVIINSSKVDNAFIINSGSIKNLTIYNAQQVGVMVEKEATVYNIVIKNTGVNSPNNNRGYGVYSTGLNSHSNCIVSVEAFNGYNEIANSKVTSKGGNADGFAVKFGAHDITFIDTHGHHNSDDGYDFWKAGDEAPIKTKEPTIRIFYSSANLNGKNPLTPNADGNGFKFGSKNKHNKPKRDKGARLIYGSVACYNTAIGFDRNGTPMKVIGMNLSARGNGKKGYDNVSNKRSSDKFKLKCKMFPRK
jgi:hypothetical protein